MTLLVSKICSAILLAGLRLLAGLLPLKVYQRLEKWRLEGDSKDQHAGHKRGKRIDMFLSMFLCFGAGLLLSTCFIHMIPEVRDSFEKAAKIGNWKLLDQFPFAEGVVCLGFFAVYLFEELGELLISSGSSQDDKDSETGPSIAMANVSHSAQHRNGAVKPSGENGAGIRPFVDNHHSHGHSHGPPISSLADPKQRSVAAAIRGFLLVFALSFHSIFEGMAIGLQTSINDVWFLFAAVTVHELAIMFCIGLEMLASKIKVAIYVSYMVTLGLITPIGVAIGIAVTEYSQDESPSHLLAIAILQGVAAGTLLYVTFLEVLERERRKDGHGMAKLGAVFIGFLLLSLLELWGGK